VCAGWQVLHHRTRRGESPGRRRFQTEHEYL
jgi:hypothetical protein